MIGRRPALLVLPPLLLGTAACGGRGDPPTLSPLRPDGYAWLTPLRLNVASVEVVDPAPSGSLRADPPAPLVPAAEVARMGRDRLSAVGTAGAARFTVETASLAREGLGSGLFSESSERLTCVLRCRVEILGADGRSTAFAEAEARQVATRPGNGDGGRARNAAEVVGRAMDDLNVEFEVQVRRSLRDWLSDTATGTPAPGITGPEPAGEPGGILREDLPRR